MSNFSEYIKNENKGKDDEGQKNKKYTQAELEEMINKYSNYGKDQLMSEFLKLTLKKKKNGELKASDLERVKNTLSPMLNEEQKNNLNQILEMVKNVE
ncbi:MAG: hypothetical protein ACI4PF_01475 [Christensenellales bacterium]